MTGKLLIGGMLAGLVAALLSFSFLKIVGEPYVDRAIAFESAMEEAKAKAKAEEAAAKGQPIPVEPAEPELVSRPVQSSIGLLTGVGVYSTAFGGLFALVFALAYGRIGELGARATSALLAGLGFVSVYVTPMLKYPANPPAVGLSETIEIRTSLYFALISDIARRDHCGWPAAQGSLPPPRRMERDDPRRRRLYRRHGRRFGGSA